MTASFRAFLLALPLAALPATGMAAADCKQDLDALKAKISEHAPASTAGGPKSTDDGWYAQGAARAKELLFNASRLADHGKDASCKELVAEARRTVGLTH